jgi:hypothetical protein
VLVFLAVALVLLVAFVWVERRAAEPMLDLSLLGRRSFLAATMGALVKGVGVLGFMIYLPSTVQRVLGISPLASAALLGVWSGVSFVAAPQARRLSGRVDARYQLAGGLGLCGLGELALIGVGEHSSWWQLVPGLAVAGVGSGFANAALAGLAVHSVPANRVAMGSGANNTSRYIGASVGTALIAAVLAMAPRGGGPAHEFSIGMTHAAIVAGAVSILGAVFVAMCRERRGLEGVAEKTSALRRC